MKFFNAKNVPSVLIVRIFTLLCIYQVCRWVAYIENVESFFDLTFVQYMTIAWGGIRFDLSALGYLNGLWIFMLILPLPIVYNIVYQRVAQYIFIIVNSIGILINLADVIYYPFSNRRSTLAIFSEFNNNTNMGKIISTGIFEHWYLFLLWILFVILVVWVSKATILLPKPHRGSSIWLYTKKIGRLAFVIFLLVYAIRGSFIHKTRPITVSNAGEYVTQAKEIFLVVNTPFTVLRLSHKKSLPAIDYYETYTALEQAYTPRQTIHKDSTNMVGKNVVIIILESFAAEYSKVFNSQREVSLTPFLDSLYQHGLLYTNSFANGRKSIDAIPSILAGIPKIQTHFSLSKYSSNTYKSLAHQLKEMGYKTLFAHGAPTGSMGFNSMAKTMGFDQFYGMDEYGNDDHYDDNWGIWDHHFFPYFNRLISELKQPFLGTIFSVNSHHPFVLPESHLNRYKDYGQENGKVIQYTDEALKEFFELAKKENWYKNTIFVITADHTSVTTYPKFSTDVGRYRVPVFFMTPDGSLLPQRIDSINIQQNDIMPSILDMVGFEGKITSFGQSVLTSTADSHFSFTTNGEYYQLIHKDFVMLYDLEKEQVFALYNFKTDPLLTTNLSTEMANQPIYNTMLTKLRGFIQQYHNRMNLDKLLEEYI